MGCNCGKSKIAQVPGASGPTARRMTVYSVILYNEVVSEHALLPEARAAAVAAGPGARVKIGSKIV